MSFGLAKGRTLDTGNVGLTMSSLPSATEGRIDPRVWFAQPEHSFEIEIGSGKGTYLVEHAPQQPDINFLGIEWAGEFFRYAADRIRRHGLTHVRMLHGDANEFLRFWCADAVANIIHLYFSDPWPKKRHHKRRVVQDETLAEFHRVLQPGGELRLVTDHDDLWAWYEEHASRNGHLFDVQPYETQAGESTAELVGSNYERKFAREGRSFHAMTLVKREWETG